MSASSSTRRVALAFASLSLLFVSRAWSEPLPEPTIVESRLALDPNPLLRTGTLPPPTEIAAMQEEREEQHELRDAWLESRHRAPGVDWRQIEEENRRALSLLRSGGGLRETSPGTWTEIGSANQAGHSRTAYPSGDGQNLFVGSAQGGVWKGTIAGANWQPIADDLGLGSNQVVVMPEGGPGEPEVVFTFSSVGGSATMHATTDNGQTWFVPAGLPGDFYEWKRMVIDPSTPRLAYLLSRSRYTSYGFILARSTNGGLNWEQRYVFPANPRCDLWIDRIEGGDLYVMAGDQMYRSTNQGGTFQLLGDANAGTVGDVVLAGSEAGGPTFYAALKVGGVWKIYRSSNAGASWTFKHNATNMWTHLTTSVTNPEIVIYGGVDCYRSTNGASTFSIINSWADYYGDPENKLHADIRGLDTHWVNGQGAIFFNTDGGTYVSYDDGATVQNLSLFGLGISQYYDTFTSSTDPYLVAAGAQDQGYQISNQTSSDPYLPFDQWISGDYGHLTSTTRDHTLLYCTYPGFILYQKFEGVNQLLMLDFPAGTNLWLPPVVADPHEEGTFYFLGDKLWKYDRNEPSYSFVRSEYADFGTGVLAALAISTVDANYWYAVEDNGNLWWSHNHGAAWTLANDGPSGHWFYGTTLIASPNDREVAYVGGSGYLGHAVWKTTNGGSTWTGIGTGLPNTLVYELVLGGQGQDELFAATEVGPYAYDEDAATWEYIGGDDAPITTYWCVEWVPEISAVRFGTYGRGAWDYRLLSPTDVAGSDVSAQPVLAAAPNPVSTVTTLSFSLESAGDVRLAIYDVAGRERGEIFSGPLPAGSHAIEWNRATTPMSAGTYFARLQSTDGVAVTKLRVLE